MFCLKCPLLLVVLVVTSWPLLSLEASSLAASSGQARNNNSQQLPVNSSTETAKATTTTTTITLKEEGHSNGRISTKRSKVDEQHRLPTWFNFELFKQLHGKNYKSFLENEVHKRIYLQTALKVLEQRASFRLGLVHSLASLNELSDLTAKQLEAFRHHSHERDTNNASGRLNSNDSLHKENDARDWTLPECCSYDQVYERIIEMLNSSVSSSLPESGSGLMMSASGKLEPRALFARALMDELEQKPFFPTKQEEEEEEEAHREGELLFEQEEDEKAPPNRAINATDRHSSATGSGWSTAQAVGVGVGGKRAPLAGGDDEALPVAKDDWRLAAGSWSKSGAVKAAASSSSGEPVAVAKSNLAPEPERPNLLAAATAATTTTTRMDNEMGRQENETVGVRQPAAGARRRGQAWRGSTSAGPLSGAKEELAGDVVTESLRSSDVTRNSGKDGDKTAPSSNRTMTIEQHQAGLQQASAKEFPGIKTLSSSQTKRPAATSSPQIEEAIRRQVAAQLSAESPLGRQLTKQLSDYFGEPVKIRVRTSGARDLSSKVDGRPNGTPAPESLKDNSN